MASLYRNWSNTDRPRALVPGKPWPNSPASEWRIQNDIHLHPNSTLPGDRAVRWMVRKVGAIPVPSLAPMAGELEGLRKPGKRRVFFWPESENKENRVTGFPLLQRRNYAMKKLIWMAMTLSWMAHAAAWADALVIDQRDEQYQIATEHLGNAARALRVAQDELKKAEAAHPLPGLNLVRMLATVQPVEQSINVILAPEKKRLEYQTIKPNGIYFSKPQIGER